MSSFAPQHVTIFGVGLLGGSIGLAVRRAFPQVTVVGVGRRQVSLDTALRVGAIHTGNLSADGVEQSDLIILATPVGVFESFLRDIKPRLKPGCLVTDVGSTKAEVVVMAEAILGAGGPFVGSHPMAGKEVTGPEHAEADLLDGALCLVTPTESTPEELTARAEWFWQSLSMRTARMSPSSHDQAVAQISHLPHLLSVLLMEQPDDSSLPLASSGFADMTRLAGGDISMWKDIVATNASPIVESLRGLASRVEELADQIESQNTSDIVQLLESAKSRREHR